MRYTRNSLVATIVLMLSGCGGSDDSAGGSFELLPPEVFTWGSQPVSVSPPPETWRRDKVQQGGLSGVRFIKSRSVGEEISISEHYALDERARCTQLTELLSDLENLDDREFALRIQRARFYVPEPINADEKRWADWANESLDRARDAHRNGQPGETRRAITDAFEQGARIQYSLDEVVDRVMFHESQYDSFGQVIGHTPVDGVIAGEQSVSVDYTLDSTERDIKYYGRQAYVLKNNRLFVFTFHGLPENIPLFEAILETVTFPPNQCVL
ncbi:MAG: hypothetical protein ACR2QU_11100 [Gammaproteobacteria bacterium]